MVWETPVVRKAMDKFVEQEVLPEGLYEILHEVVEDTFAHQGDFAKASSATGKAVVEAMHAFAKLLREMDLDSIMRDRLRDPPHRSKVAFDACSEACDTHRAAGLDDESVGKLSLSLSRLVFVRGVISYSSGVALWLVVDEVADRALHLGMLEAASEFFCEEACMAFEHVARDLRELESLGGGNVGGEIASFVAHAFLGLWQDKLFRSVMSAAAGKSPHQELAAIRRSIETMATCRQKANFFRNHIAQEAREFRAGRGTG